MGAPLDQMQDGQIQGMTRRLPHGAVITRQGAAVGSLFLVTSGAVRLSAVTATGREVVVGLLCRGDLFGEISLRDGGPRTATVVSETPLTALALSRKDFRSMLETEPHVTVGLLKHAAQLLRRLEHPASG